MKCRSKSLCWRAAIEKFSEDGPDLCSELLNNTVRNIVGRPHTFPVFDFILEPFFDEHFDVHDDAASKMATP